MCDLNRNVVPSNATYLFDEHSGSTRFAMARGAFKLRSASHSEVSQSLLNAFDVQLNIARNENRDFRILALSTGGPWGAFGAGFLEGLSQNDSAHYRKYDLVTGSSAGAITAPFAFIGDTETLADVSDYWSTLSDDKVLRKRSLISLLWADSLFDTNRMKDYLIEVIKNKRIVEKIGIERTNSHRVLVVMAVNVDTGQIDIFDLTAIATSDLDLPTRQKMIADRILASASVPLAFNPVYIDGCKYSDAGLRRNLFVTSEFIAKYVETAGNTFNTQPSKFGGDEFVLTNFNLSDRIPVRVDIVINGEAMIKREIIDKGLKPTAMRGIPIIMNSTMWASISRIADLAAVMKWDLNYVDASEFSATNDSSVFSLSGNVFDPEFMSKLNTFGKNKGLSDDPWLEIPAPPDPAIDAQ